MSFGSDSLFAAFGTDGWSANNSKASFNRDNKVFDAKLRNIFKLEIEMSNIFEIFYRT